MEAYYNRKMECLKINFIHYGVIGTNKQINSSTVIPYEKASTHYCLVLFFLYQNDLCYRAEKDRQVVQGELTDLLQASDRSLLERSTLEKQVKTYQAQEQVS